MGNEMPRRNFVRGAVAAAGVSALAGLVGCSSSAEGSSESTTSSTSSDSTASWMPTWDYETDIIAVGAGGAGLAAANEARDNDLEIIVLESMAAVGGNSKVCGGGIAMAGTPIQEEEGIVDNADIMFEDIMNAGGVGQNENYVRLISELNVGLFAWLTDMGIDFKEGGLIGSAGMSVPREHHVPAFDVITTLEQNANDKGATILVNTPAKHIIRHPETKRAIGIEAVDENGETIYLKARKGIVMASGGYARNTDMINQYVLCEGAEALEDTTYDVEGQNGEGILMCLEAGAQHQRLDYISMCTVQNPDGPIGDATAMYHVGAILVNQEGERFVNEQGGYGKMWPYVNAQTGRYCYQVWDNAIATEYADNDTLYYNQRVVEETGLLLQGDTIEELAEAMGVPADALTAAVDKYNSDIAANGVDSVYGRDALVSTTGVPVELAEGPFFAFKTANALMTTFGGVKQDDTCRAMDVFGQGIESLYVAGNISGYCNFGVEPNSRQGHDTSGTGFGGGMTFGRYCVNQIKDLDNWE